MREKKSIAYGKYAKKYGIEIALALALLLTMLCACCGQFLQDCATARQEFLRLHILANSDSQEDQELKGKVRDRLLAESEQWFGQVEDKEEAEAALQSRLPQIAAIAQDELRKNGCKLPVRVQLCHSAFPTRDYQTFTLPAGDYDALRVLIGEGAGQNWWCVMFPPLCLPAAFDEETADWFSSHQLTVLEQKSAYEPRFALAELWEKWKNRD